MINQLELAWGLLQDEHSDEDLALLSEFRIGLKKWRSSEGASHVSPGLCASSMMVNDVFTESC
jgi:hypothetical protein